jgi:hypothetical protein
MNNNLMCMFEGHLNSINIHSLESAERTWKYHLDSVDNIKDDKLEYSRHINDVNLPPENFKPPRPRDPFRPIPNLHEFQTFSSIQTDGKSLKSPSIHIINHAVDTNATIHSALNLGN